MQIAIILSICILIYSGNHEIKAEDVVITTIGPLYERGANGIAFDSNNGNMYVTNTADNTVSVIDGKTNKVIEPAIKVGAYPRYIAFDSTNDNLYVVNSPPHGVEPYYESISVIDGKTNKVISTPRLHLPTVANSADIVFDSNLGYVYVVMSASNLAGHIFIIDSAAKEPLRFERTSTCFSRDVPIDCPWASLDGAIPGANKIAFNPANGNIYVASTNMFVKVISDSTFKEVGSASVATSVGDTLKLGGMAINSANGNVYVALSSERSVAVIDGVTNKVIDGLISVGHEPGDIAFDSANGNLYVTNRGDDTVSVIDGTTNKVMGSPIKVGHQPGSIAFNSANKNLYVVNEGDNTISVIGPKPDIIPPSITLTAPADGSTIGSSTFIVSGTASDNLDGSGLLKVEVQTAAGGVFRTAKLGTTTPTGITSWTLETPLLPDGIRTITAKATDEDGNSADSKITVTVGAKYPPSLRGQGEGLIVCKDPDPIRGAMLPVKSSLFFTTLTDEMGTSGNFTIELNDNGTSKIINGTLNKEKTFTGDNSFLLSGFPDSDTYCNSLNVPNPAGHLPPTIISISINGFIGDGVSTAFRLYVGSDLKVDSKYEGTVHSYIP